LKVAPISALASSPTTSTITVRTLTDGGQKPLDVAGQVADFLAAAKRTLDLAQYDFNLGPETAAVVGAAIREAAARGVEIRIAYNLDHRLPIPVPPPPEPDAALIEGLGVPSQAIAGVPDLMHHKYVVRDGEAVWTGSLNWTDDSWSRQENVIAVVHSPELAARFTKDFDQMWKAGTVEETGRVDPSAVETGGVEVRAWFTPTYGEDLSHRIANAIGRARRRVRICSPVLTAAPVISTLAQRVSEGNLDIAGCIDATQINGVFHDWHRDGNAAWKIPILERVLEAPFSGKPSAPYQARSVHDFMHAKVTVADDVVFTGSFNLSRRGEKNAENMIEIHDAALAERLASFVDDVRARYPRFQHGGTQGSPLGLLLNT
jgi:phosphatidylserine/phosphatidylglycerophosphate/cardiolipin synthase-like enzyme